MSMEDVKEEVDYTLSRAERRRAFRSSPNEDECYRD